MNRSLDSAQSFLERLEARGDREAAVLAGEFSDIQARSAAWKADGVCSTEAGSQPGNVRKNRYKDVLPYDQTRVILSLLQEEGHSDYINGNFIRGADGSRAYIATQGPLPHTLLDFWRLIWEFGVKVILMACREIENSRKRCERYWAQEQEPLQTGLFCITLVKEKPLNEDIVLRTLKVTFQKESRSVYQLQYMSWPDRGVPSSPDHMLAMVEEARHLQGSGSEPLCVHCSAGCGRTGVLCTVDYVRQLLLTQMIPPDFSLFDVVLEMRKQRPAAVQTEEQYRFLYHTVAQMFRSTLQNASPLYQNLKEVQRPLSHSPVHHQHPQRPGPRARSSTQDSWEQSLTMTSTCALLQAPLSGCPLLSFLPESCERPGQFPPSGASLLFSPRIVPQCTTMPSSSGLPQHFSPYPTHQEASSGTRLYPCILPCPISQTNPFLILGTPVRSLFTSPSVRWPFLRIQLWEPSPGWFIYPSGHLASASKADPAF
uniref:protein-tyrosine-phosphatase n=1 Tax=Callithrix jacchus TaxID=9483 RepID=A0A8I3W7B4_CALJA